MPCLLRFTLRSLVHPSSPSPHHAPPTLQWTGKQFDSSVNRGPFDFTIGSGQVIQGWELGLLDMCIGEKRKLKIPSASATAHRAPAAPSRPTPRLSSMVSMSFARSVDYSAGTQHAHILALPLANTVELLDILGSRANALKAATGKDEL